MHARHVALCVCVRMCVCVCVVKTLNQSLCLKLMQYQPQRPNTEGGRSFSFSGQEHMTDFLPDPTQALEETHTPSQN